MKKFILTLFVLLSIGIFANDEIISELKGLNAEYEDLVKEEEARFQKEKELSEALLFNTNDETVAEFVAFYREKKGLKQLQKKEKQNSLKILLMV